MFFSHGSLINHSGLHPWGQEVSDSSVTFLSLVGQVFPPFSLKLLKLQTGDEAGGSISIECMSFSPKLKSGPCFQIVSGARAQRGQGLPWVGSASGLAPNICSKLQTGPDLEKRNECSRWQIVLPHWGPRPAPPSSFSQRCLSPARPEYRTHF